MDWQQRIFEYLFTKHVKPSQNGLHSSRSSREVLIRRLRAQISAGYIEKDLLQKVLPDYHCEVGQDVNVRKILRALEAQEGES